MSAERVAAGDLIRAWQRAMGDLHLSDYLTGSRVKAVEDAGDALADRLEELTKVQDPCPECGENVIQLQKGSTRWSCKNNHMQERK